MIGDCIIAFIFLFQCRVGHIFRIKWLLLVLSWGFSSSILKSCSRHFQYVYTNLNYVYLESRCSRVFFVLVQRISFVFSSFCFVCLPWFCKSLLYTLVLLNPSLGLAAVITVTCLTWNSVHDILLWCFKKYRWKICWDPNLTDYWPWKCDSLFSIFSCWILSYGSS